MKIINIEQRSPEWLLWRNSGIGASECAAVLGMSIYKTPVQVWEEKTGRGFGTQMNADMQRGVDFEDEARGNFEFVHGKVFVPLCVEHANYPYIIASLDGLSADLTEFVEVKCPRTDKLLRICAKKDVAKFKKEYPEYWCQMQHQYAVTGAESGYMVAYLNKNIEYLLIPRDAEFIQNTMVPELSRFWFEYVKADIRPPMSDKDTDYTNDIGCMALAKEYCGLNTQIGKLEEMKELIRASLQEKTGNKNMVVGDVLKISKYVTTGADYKRACEENCIDMSKYQKDEKTAFRFTMID